MQPLTEYFHLSTKHRPTLKVGNAMKVGARSTTGWRATISVAMSNYIEAGSIIAIATSLAFWQAEFGISNFAVGLLAALSANAFGAAIGAILGGPLCDRFGRKAIYTYDLLVYMAGVLLAAFAVNYTMLLAAFIITGIAVGAGVPASWTYIAEQAPSTDRAKHVGTAQLAWSIGPLIGFALAAALAPTGTARLSADLPAPVRRRRRGLVDPAGPAGIADLGRRGQDRTHRDRVAVGAARPARTVLPQGQHRRTAVPRRHLPVLEHRRRPGRHLHAPRLRHRGPAQSRRAEPAAGPGVGLHRGGDLLRLHEVRRPDVATPALRPSARHWASPAGSSWSRSPTAAYRPC